MLHGKMGTKRGTTLDATISCSACKGVRHVLIREELPVEVRVVVSDRTLSERSAVMLDRSAEVEVGDELDDEVPLLVTAIETTTGRVSKSRAGEIRTIWAKRFDRIHISVSVNRGRKTESTELTVVPDEEFSVGQTIALHGRRVVIHAIKTHDKMIRTGAAEARDVVRVYTRPVFRRLPAEVRRRPRW